MKSHLRMLTSKEDVIGIYKTKSVNRNLSSFPTVQELVVISEMSIFRTDINKSQNHRIAKVGKT